MSAGAEHTPALEYLTDAAHLLQTTAPGTSAHLMSQRNDLMWHHGMSMSETQRQDICGACGNIMVPGKSSALKLDTLRTRHPTKKMEPRRAKGTTKVIQCRRCEKKTKTKIDPIPRSKFTVSKANTTRPVPDSSNAPPKSTTAQSNASSKKRAKNRKAGLQALLAGQQKSNSLSLSDFMKK